MVGTGVTYGFRTESPIEATFVSAILHAVPAGWVDEKRHGDVFLRLNEFTQGIPLEEQIWFRIRTQVRCGGYRLDIMLTRVVPPAWGKPAHRLWIDVECDGHDFHEKTKEQVQHDKERDRLLQAIGFRVFRFTGSEIYCDPEGAAERLISLVRFASEHP